MNKTLILSIQTAVFSTGLSWSEPVLVTADEAARLTRSLVTEPVLLLAENSPKPRQNPASPRIGETPRAVRAPDGAKPGSGSGSGSGKTAMDYTAIQDPSGANGWGVINGPVSTTDFIPTKSERAAKRLARKLNKAEDQGNERNGSGESTSDGVRDQGDGNCGVGTGVRC